MLFVVLLSVVSPSVGFQKWRTVYQRITQEQQFSGFNEMIRNNRIAKLNLHYYDLTVFVPENQAITDYRGDVTEDLVFYHMSFGVKTLKLLNQTSFLETAGDNGPVWITSTNQGIFVNNAKILGDKSNFLSNTREDLRGKNQVLHVVDRVLDPKVKRVWPNPSAYSFLSEFYRWSIGENRVSSYLTKIQEQGQEKLLKLSGGHTFFLPVDSRLDDYKLQKIDSYVIQGHVIPNQVLFTRPTSADSVFETLANGDFIYILVSMFETNGKNYVKSHTVLGNSNHEKGELTAEIVEGNIPVTNGVVHLISQPLAVFDRQLKPFPYLPVLYKISSDPNLNLTYNLGELSKINRILDNSTSFFTYFAPTDRSWTDLPRSSEEIERVLGRHLVVAAVSYSIEKLARLTALHNGTVLPTVGGPIKFQVYLEEDGYFLVCNGVRSRVSRANYECSDGVVHVIETPLVAGFESKSRGRNFWGVLKTVTASIRP